MVLTELRKLYKVSMQELASDIGVSKQLIGQIEKGNRAITDDVLYKLVDFFHLDRSIALDLRNFLLKERMDEIERLKVEKAKLIKESKTIKLEQSIKPDSEGVTFISYDTLDRTGYKALEFNITTGELHKIIDKSISEVFNKNTDNEGTINYDEAFTDAIRKAELYKKIIGTMEEDKYHIFEKCIEAFEISIKGGAGKTSFIDELATIFKVEMDRNRNEQRVIGRKPK